MKQFILTLAAGLLLSSPFFAMANYYHNQADASAASWAAFCEAYNVDPDEPTDEQINYYLDAWRGSVDEENALTPEQNAEIN